MAGALVIGVMARYGSERIRGHGIPDALEAILIRGSRVEPKLAVLEPLSAAISIGSVATHRMAVSGVTELPVVARAGSADLVGVITLADMLVARRRHVEEETRRERVLSVRRFFPHRPV